MLTIEQAKEYLQSIGVTLPDFLLSALIAQMGDIQDCLDANGVGAGTQTLIYTYLLALLALAQGDKYISSQTAPSGASQSFRYMSLADRWKSINALLRGVDKFGCALPLVPADPTQKAFGGLWVSGGNCDE